MANPATNQTYAEGVYSQTYTLNTNAAVNLFNVGDPSTQVIQRPASNFTAYILALSVSVSVAGTTDRLAISDSVTGSVIFRFAPNTVDTTQSANWNYPASPCGVCYRGYALPPGASLVATLSGTTAPTIDVQVVFEVR